MRDGTSEGGFTLLEVVIVGMIAATLAATSMVVLPGVIEAARGASGASQLTAVLRTAREQSIAERRHVEVRFVAPNRLECWRDDVDASGVVAGQTLIREAVLEQGVTYQRFDGTPDTPDGFAPGPNPISFTGAAPWRFTTDGQFVDANGDVVNGTVFLGVPWRPDTARAVALFGPTAAIREWRWNGAAWTK